MSAEKFILHWSFFAFVLITIIGGYSSAETDLQVNEIRESNEFEASMFADSESGSGSAEAEKQDVVIKFKLFVDRMELNSVNDRYTLLNDGTAMIVNGVMRHISVAEGNRELFKVNDQGQIVVLQTGKYKACLTVTVLEMSLIDIGLFVKRKGTTTSKRANSDWGKSCPNSASMRRIVCPSQCGKISVEKGDVIELILEGTTYIFDLNFTFQQLSNM